MTMQKMTARKTNPAQKMPAPSMANGVQILEGVEWLETVVALHAQVRTELPESQRHFLLPKPPSYFHDLLTRKTGVLLGAFAEGHLAGTMAIVTADHFAAAHAAGRITCPDDDGKLTKLYGTGTIGVCQSLCVLNAWLGRSLSRTLVEAGADWARQNGCAHLFAQIADQNMLSWMRFMVQDFALVATWHSEWRRYLLRHMTAGEKAALHQKPTGQHIYRKDYAQLPALLTELTARLEQGQIVVLDTRPDDLGALCFVFGKRKK